MGREDARRLCQVSAIFTVHFHMSRSILYSQAFLFSLQSKVFPFRRKPRPAVLLKSTALCKQPEWLLAVLEALPAGRNPAPRASLLRSPGLGTMGPGAASLGRMSPSLAGVCMAGKVQEELGLGQLPAPFLAPTAPAGHRAQSKAGAVSRGTGGSSSSHASPQR